MSHVRARPKPGFDRDLTDVSKSNVKLLRHASKGASQRGGVRAACLYMCVHVAMSVVV